jgi:hypothetical protein
VSREGPVTIDDEAEGVDMYCRARNYNKWSRHGGHLLCYLIKMSRHDRVHLLSIGLLSR